MSELLVCELVHDIRQHPKGKNGTQDEENGTKSGQNAFWICPRHLSFFGLFHRMKEEDDSGLISFHICHRAKESLTLTVCQGLKKNILKKMSTHTKALPRNVSLFHTRLSLQQS